MSFPLDQAMRIAVSSVVPAPDGSQVIVDEGAHASTRTPAMQDRTLQAIQDAMPQATTSAQREFLRSAMLKFGASYTLRQIAANPSLVQQQEQAAAAGDPTAAQIVQGIAVMQVADMKDDARALATGLSQAHPEAIAQAQQVNAAAATPGHPQQSLALALQSLVAQVQQGAGLPPPSTNPVPVLQQTVPPAGQRPTPPPSTIPPGVTVQQPTPPPSFIPPPVTVQQQPTPPPSFIPPSSFIPPPVTVQQQPTPPPSFIPPSSFIPPPVTVQQQPTPPPSFIPPAQQQPTPPPPDNCGLDAHSQWAQRMARAEVEEMARQKQAQHGNAFTPPCPPHPNG
jgi:hypothetical protein